MRYHKIDIAMMDELEVTLHEFLALNIVYSFSTNPNAPTPGWCTASAKTIAGFLRLGERTVQRFIGRLSKKISNKTPALILKDESGRFKKTSKHYNEVLFKYQNEGASKRRTPRQNGERTPPDRRRFLRRFGVEKAAKVADYVYKNVNDNVKEDEEVFIKEAKKVISNWCEIIFDDIISTSDSTPNISKQKHFNAAREKYLIRLFDDKWGGPAQMTFEILQSGFKSWIIKWVANDQKGNDSNSSNSQNYDESYED